MSAMSADNKEKSAAPAAATTASWGDLWNDPASEQVRVAAGTVLFEPNTPAQHVWYVEQGQVRLYQKGPTESRLLQIVGPGEWFGASALANSPVYGKRASSVGTSLLRRIAANRFLQHLCERPGPAAIGLVRQLAARILEAREDAARLAFDDCHSRLIKALVRFSGSAAATMRGDEVVLRITHHELAQAVGAARETISLALTELRQQNLLQTGRNQLTYNPTLLTQWFAARRVAEQRQPVESAA